MERITDNSTSPQYIPSSPVFLGEEESSTCLLLSSPSPTPLGYGHPLEDNQLTTPFLAMPEIVCTRDEAPLSEDPLGGDSSSSADSNSVVHDPVSAQLINNISMLDYQTLSKTGDLILTQDEECKLNGTTQPVSRKLPAFVTWNWNVIRKVFLWVVLSGLFACCAAVVALMVTLPKSCNPELEWYQGSVFYEIFPASFQDSNNDGIGDLNGLTSRIDYINNLGMKAVRLNSIFQATHYPEQYYNIISLYHIDPVLGTLKDFNNMEQTMANKNISLLLDLPLFPYIKRLNPVHINGTQILHYQSHNENKDNTPDHGALIKSKDGDIISVLKYWIMQGVDGFYLKGLENFVDDPNFVESILVWKKVIGELRPLIISYELVHAIKLEVLMKIIHKIDLVDVLVDVSNGTENIKADVHTILNGLLWSKPGYPWIHWTVGSLNTKRLSSKVSKNISLAFTMLELMLPGTPSIFYGDEINLEGLTEVEDDFHESKHIQNLTPMMWSQIRFPSNGVLPWLSTSDKKEHPFHFIEIISKLCKLRASSPTIYLNGIWKEGNNNPNTQVRNSGKDVLIVERWYPRRNSYVLVTNIGEESITKDLSSMFYGGTVMVSSDLSLIDKTVYFGGIKLDPGVVIVIKLEK